MSISLYMLMLKVNREMSLTGHDDDDDDDVTQQFWSFRLYRLQLDSLSDLVQQGVSSSVGHRGSVVLLHLLQLSAPSDLFQQCGLSCRNW